MAERATIALLPQEAVHVAALATEPQTGLLTVGSSVGKKRKTVAHPGCSECPLWTSDMSRCGFRMWGDGCHTTRPYQHLLYRHVFSASPPGIPDVEAQLFGANWTLAKNHLAELVVEAKSWKSHAEQEHRLPFFRNAVLRCRVGPAQLCLERLRPLLALVTQEHAAAFLSQANAAMNILHQAITSLQELQAPLIVTPNGSQAGVALITPALSALSLTRARVTATVDPRALAVPPATAPMAASTPVTVVGDDEASNNSSAPGAGNSWPPPPGAAMEAPHSPSLLDDSVLAMWASGSALPLQGTAFNNLDTATHWS